LLSHITLDTCDAWNNNRTLYTPESHECRNTTLRRRAQLPLRHSADMPLLLLLLLLPLLLLLKCVTVVCVSMTCTTCLAQRWPTTTSRQSRPSLANDPSCCLGMRGGGGRGPDLARGLGADTLTDQSVMYCLGGTTGRGVPHAGSGVRQAIYLKNTMQVTESGS
jgi:hypothetical protein